METKDPLAEMVAHAALSSHYLVKASDLPTEPDAKPVNGMAAKIELDVKTSAYLDRQSKDQVKELTPELLATQIAEFEARGGEIQHIPAGFRADPPRPPEPRRFNRDEMEIESDLDRSRGGKC